LAVLAIAGLLSIVFIKYANPSPDWFSQNGAYYLTANKFTYWVEDSYDYFKNKNAAAQVLTDAALKKKLLTTKAASPLTLRAQHILYCTAITSVMCWAAFLTCKKRCRIL
jgi:hypothetical protein